MPAVYEDPMTWLLLPYLAAMDAGGPIAQSPSWIQTRGELLWLSRAFVRASARNKTLDDAVHDLNGVLHGRGYHYIVGTDRWDVSDDVDRVGVQGQI